MQPFWITFLFLAPTSSSPVSQEKTPSWVDICDSTYLFSEEAKSWHDASGECELYGSHIVQIDDLAENFCLLEYAHTVGLSGWWWQGANDILSEGVWRQNDGTLLSWTPFWKTATADEPSGARAENCGSYCLQDDALAGQWADWICDRPQYYICERGFKKSHVANTTLTEINSYPPKPSSQEETPSWVNICGGSYLFSEDTKTWDSAFGECELYGSHLAQIDTLAENFCLLDYAHTTGLGGYWWHSANDIASEGIWRHYDETALTWSPWWKSDNNNPDGGRAQNCAHVFLAEDVYAGQWGDSVCQEAQQYICEKGLENPAIINKTEVNLSSSLNQENTPSWVNICDGTYLFSEEAKSWHDAAGKCELYGSHTVQIDTLAENFCLLDYAQTMGYSTEYWHSANDIASEGVWRQYDGTLLSWSPWWSSETDEPDGGKSQNCGKVTLSGSAHAGLWYSHFCDQIEYYICERDL